MSKFELPRATRDFLPGETAARNHVRAGFVKAAESYGFQEVQTPIFEHVELFSARSGPEIKGSMLTFHCDHEEFALRPEMTAPVCRLMSSGALAADQLPHKLFYFGPCFRYSRPHSGRYREFLQAGFECLGASGPDVDADVVAAAGRVLRGLGIDDFALKIGSIGIFRDLLPDDLDAEDRATVIGHLDQLIGIHDKCRRFGAGSDASVVDDLRSERMELAALQARTEYSGPNSIAKTPQIGPEKFAARLPAEAEVTFRRLWKVEELLSDETAELLIKTSRLRGPLATIREQALELLAETPATAALDELLSVCRRVEMYGIKNFEVALGIARGFTFYTSTIFEITSGPANGGILYCGGGRYDRLVELFGGPPMPSAGCAFRFDALVDAFLSADSWREPAPYQLFLLAESDEQLPEAIRFGEQLRERGLRVGVTTRGSAKPSAADFGKYKTEAIGTIRGGEPSVLDLTDGSGVRELPLDADTLVTSLRPSNP